MFAQQATFCWPISLYVPFRACLGVPVSVLLCVRARACVSSSALVAVSPSMVVCLWVYNYVRVSPIGFHMATSNFGSISILPMPSVPPICRGRTSADGEKQWHTGTAVVYKVAALHDHLDGENKGREEANKEAVCEKLPPRRAQS